MPPPEDTTIFHPWKGKDKHCESSYELLSFGLLESALVIEMKWLYVLKQSTFY